MNQIFHDHLPFILGRSPMKTMLWISAWTFVAFTALLSASEISYAPLPKIVKDAAWIIKGKIVSANRKDTPDANKVEYVVAPTTVLMGLPTVPQKVKLSYEEYNPVIKDDQGKPVGWASPIYSGSGKEFSVKAGEEWIFLFVANQLSGTDATSILRVEPVSQDAEIRSILAIGSAEKSPALPVPPQDAPGGAAFANENIVHDDGTGAQISFFLPTHDKRGSLEVEYASYNIIVVNNGRFLLLEDLSGSKTEDGKAFFGKIIIPSEFIDSAEIGMWGSPRNASLGIEKKLKVSTFKKILREKCWTEQKSATEVGAIRLESNRDAATIMPRIRAAIEAGPTFAKLFDILGEPDVDIGSGIHIFVYRLSDGAGITVGTPDKKKVMYIEHANKRLFPVEAKLAAGSVIKRGDKIGQHLGDGTPLKKNYGEPKPLLDFPSSVGANTEVMMWKVGDGILVIATSLGAGFIEDISYVITDSKDEKRTTLKVKEFNPSTGEMTLAIPNTHNR